MKILWCSDNIAIPTGYAQVGRNILSRLHKTGNHEIHTYSFQFMDANMAKQVNVSFPVYYPIDSTDFYGNKGGCWNVINQLKPDLAFFLCDHFMINWLIEKKQPWKIYRDLKIPYKFGDETKTRFLFYFPFDSDLVYDKSKDVIECFDIKVAMSKFSQRILREQTDIESHYIPHGVDTNVYRPINQSIIEKIKFDNKWQDKFIIGCVARNQTRKIIPALLRAFNKLDKKYPEKMMLYLQCSPDDPSGWKLKKMIDQYKIKGKIHFGQQNYMQALPESHMNITYNLFDIHVLPTSGEGFGLPIIESMAAGTPNIMSDCTTARELLEGHGEFIKIWDYLPGQLNTPRAFPDVNDMADKIEKLYLDENLRKKYGKDGRNFVLEGYNWEKVLRMWNELLDFGEVKEQ